MIPLIFRISLANIANFCTGVGSLAFCLPGLALFFLLKKYPELYEKSPYKLPKRIIPVMAIASFTISILQGLLLLSGFPLPLVLAVLIYGIIAIVAGIIMEKKRPIPRDLAPSL
jgi:APA family basic amino acid/polyamine antiporter